MKRKGIENFAHECIRRCVDCFGKCRQKQSREAIVTIEKEIKSFCPNHKYCFVLIVLMESTFVDPLPPIAVLD